MILGFSTTWPDGTENYFPHLIAQSLVSREHIGIPDHVNTIKTDLQVVEITAYRNKYRRITGKGFAFPFGAKERARYEGVQKLHTLRSDNERKWKPGALIQPWSGMEGFSDSFQFCPTLFCTGVQTVMIQLESGKLKATIVEEGTPREIDVELLAKNDGFPDLRMFRDYWRLDEKRSQTLIRRIIHWAEVKY